MTLFLIILILVAIVAMLFFIAADVESCIRRSMERPADE